MRINLKKWVGVVLVYCCSVFFFNNVQAQAESSEDTDEWQYAGGIYLWGADVKGKTHRGSEVEVEFSDLLDNLEMGFMGVFKARKNKWSVLADVIYLDLEADNTTELSIPIGPKVIPVTTQTSLDMKGWVLQFAGGYNLYSEGKSRLDVVGGVRYLDLDMDLFLGLQSIGPGQSRTISESLTAWNGIVGLEGQVALGEKWYLPYYLDIGTGESDITWQATAGVGYRVAEIWDLVLLYQHLEWDLDSTRVLDDLSFSGPTLGIIFRW